MGKMSKLSRFPAESEVFPHCASSHFAKRRFFCLAVVSAAMHFEYPFMYIWYILNKWAYFTMIRPILLAVELLLFRPKL